MENKTTFANWMMNELLIYFFATAEFAKNKI